MPLVNLRCAADGGCRWSGCSQPSISAAAAPGLGARDGMRSYGPAATP